MTRTVLCAALALTLAACGGDDDADRAAGSAPDSAAIDSSMSLVTRAAAVTLGVEELPAAADSILAAAGLTIEQYEGLMYRISADPELSSLYQSAVGGKR